MVERKIEGMKVIFTPAEVQEITDNIAAVLKSGHLIKGLFLDDFAARVGNRCGKSRTALCSSDTAAMEMLFVVLGVRGKKVIFQGNMFPSPIFACMRAGGDPMYADMELGGLGMSPSSLDEVMGLMLPNELGAVVVMHTAGIISPEFYDIVSLCKQRGVTLIEDCAHAYGATDDKQEKGAGSWGDYAVFSFYATKPMATGEGGAVCSENGGVVEKFEMLSRYGKTEIFGPPFCEYPGYSNRMTELLAAVGVVADKYLYEKISRRRAIGQVYDLELNVDATVYNVPGGNQYKYVLMPDQPHDRVYFQKVMKEEYGIGIPAGVYDFPVYRQKPLVHSTEWKGLPKSELFCNNHVCLPMHEGLSDDDARYVANAVNEVLGR